MTRDVRPAPDMKRVGAAWLRERFPAELGTVDGVLRVRQDEPDNLRDFLAQHTYFALVRGLGGRSSQIEVTSGLDFEVFALTDAAAGDLARRIDAAFVRRYHRLQSGASIDTVISTLSPEAVAWRDAGVRRYVSSYSVTTRR